MAYLRGGSHVSGNFTVEGNLTTGTITTGTGEALVSVNPTVEKIDYLAKFSANSVVAKSQVLQTSAGIEVTNNSAGTGSVNRIIITPPATSATLTIANGATLTVSASATLNQSLTTTSSPTFAGLILSGTPTAPTAAVGTNTTQIATTAFVHRITPPIGFVYWQLPGKTDPATLYPGTTWSNISSTFAGLFFRAEGGNALSFGGGTQGTANLSHNHTGLTGNDSPDHSHTVKASGGGGNNGLIWSSGTAAYSTSGASARHKHAIGADGTTESRPVNQTIRLWERTA